MLTAAKYKGWILVLLGLTVVTLLTNSCKKDNNDTVQYFLTNGTWTLASVQRFHFVGDTQGATDTLNATCQATQTFVFNSNNTCTYTNYHCLTQSNSGSWIIGSDNVSLTTTLTAQDTLKGAKVSVNAFGAAKIITLGQYSLVLQTGDIESYYKATTVRTIVQYGFVHATTP